MSIPVRVHLLPPLFQPAELAGGAAVIIDVLRASTTMIQALHAGATCVIPCAGVDEAHQQAARFSSDRRLLGGERHGVRIEGFDLDNSPRAYLPELVGGRALIFTTTNGTQALRRAQEAAAVCVGAFVNLSAVDAYLRSLGLPVHLVCAGTDGRITAEDVLFAGLLADRLHGSDDPPTDVATEMAIHFARRHAGSPADIRETLRDSLGGRNLLELGFDADIDFAAQVDTVATVPVWDRATGELRHSR